MEAANEISKEIRHIAFEESKQQIQYATSTNQQLDNLMQEADKIKSCLNESLQANNRANDKLYSLVSIKLVHSPSWLN